VEEWSGGWCPDLKIPATENDRRGAKEEKSHQPETAVLLETQRPITALTYIITSVRNSSNLRHYTRKLIHTMLKGIDPLLTPELLQALRAMGHGDTIAIVDANFPAASNGRPVIRLAGATATQTAGAILSVLPLDTFTPEAAWCMEVVGDAAANLPIMDEFRESIVKHEGSGFALHKLERFKFYEEARKAFVVVSTSEVRLYGNLLLKKGVVGSA
jgi:L-fucose mutarotase